MKTVFSIFLVACFIISSGTLLVAMSDSYNDWYNFRNPMLDKVEADPESPQPISHTFAHGCYNGVASPIMGVISLMDNQNKVYEVNNPNHNTYFVGFITGLFGTIALIYVILIGIFSESNKDDSSSDDSNGLSIMNPANPASPFSPIHQIH